MREADAVDLNRSNRGGSRPQLGIFINQSGSIFVAAGDTMADQTSTTNELFDVATMMMMTMKKALTLR